MITINLDKAKNIWRDKIRIDRQNILSQLDIEFIRSIETNNIKFQQDIIYKKQLLRDAPADPRISYAVSIDELLDINPIKDIGY